VYVFGNTTGTLHGQASFGGLDSFALHFDCTGRLTWTFQFGGEFADSALTLALAPGRSIYVAGSTLDALGGPDQGHPGSYDAYVARIAAPATADFNTDSLLNSADFFEFLVAFFASDPSADVNSDNAINSNDFFDFLDAFFRRC
jgi:hypothetical protein